MTNTDVIFAFVTGMQLREHQATASLSIVHVQRADDYAETALLSYGVPIARRSERDGNVFVDCFSDWSRTTTQHQHEAYALAKAHAPKVHRVTYGDMQPDRFTPRVPPKERRKPIGSTL